MKLSIITTTYNSAATITESVISVNNQTYQNIEHIIIDGASTDDTIKIIKSTPSRVTNVVSETDKGIYDALNKGIHLAKGEIIGFLHSDDLFASTESIQHIVDAFNNNGYGQKSVDVVYGDLVFINKQNINKVVRYWKSKRFKPNMLQRGWMPPHPTIFMRREVYEKYGLFNISLKCAADYDFILRVFNDQSLMISYLPEVITKMRVGGVSTGGIKNIINKKKEDYWVLKNNQMQFPLWILFVKNISKIPQLIFRRRKIYNNNKL